MSPETQRSVPDFGRRLYGATAWAYKFPLEKGDINPTFARARETFDKTGFSGVPCSIEWMVLYAPDPQVELHYAEQVRVSAEKYNLVPVTTLFRPQGQSMVGCREERRQAVAQIRQGINLGMMATPQKWPVVVNGPLQLVHKIGKKEILNKRRRGLLVDCLKEIDDTLEERGKDAHTTREIYAALEPLRQEETAMPTGIPIWLDILNQAQGKRIGILFDTVHAYCGVRKNMKKMLDALRQTCEAERCYSIHLSNYPNRLSWEEQGEIAKYTSEIIQIAKENGCNITIDWEGFDTSLDGAVDDGTAKSKRRTDQQNQLEVVERSMKYLNGFVRQIPNELEQTV